MAYFIWGGGGGHCLHHKLLVKLIWRLWTQETLFYSSSSGKIQILTPSKINLVFDHHHVLVNPWNSRRVGSGWLRPDGARDLGKLSFKASIHTVWLRWFENSNIFFPPFLISEFDFTIKKDFIIHLRISLNKIGVGRRFGYAVFKWARSDCSECDVHCSQTAKSSMQPRTRNCDRYVCLSSMHESNSTTTQDQNYMSYEIDSVIPTRTENRLNDRPLRVRSVLSRHSRCMHGITTTCPSTRNRGRAFL